MKRQFTWTLIAVICLGSLGCVSQRRADNLQTLYRKSQEQVLELEARLEEANARIAMLGAGGDAALQAQLEDALADRDRLQIALEDAKAQIAALGAEVILPPELDAALEQLAASNPDIMEYDPELGMVKFRSDLTFALGSAQVSVAAKQTLGRLAGVLKSPAAQDYEVRIVGHTDNVPVTNAANKQRFGDNWGLSAFRAIGVKNALQSSGLQPQRMSVAGYGQFRPVVANGPRGAEANRRVEIYLTPLVQPGAPKAEAQPAPAAPQPTPAPRSTAPAEPSNFK